LQVLLFLRDLFNQLGFSDVVTHQFALILMYEDYSPICSLRISPREVDPPSELL